MGCWAGPTLGLCKKNWDVEKGWALLRVDLQTNEGKVERAKRKGWKWAILVIFWASLEERARRTRTRRDLQRYSAGTLRHPGPPKVGPEPRTGHAFSAYRLQRLSCAVLLLNSSLKIPLQIGTQWLQQFTLLQKKLIIWFTHICKTRVSIIALTRRYLNILVYKSRLWAFCFRFPAWKSFGQFYSLQWPCTQRRIGGTHDQSPSLHRGRDSLERRFHDHGMQSSFLFITETWMYFGPGSFHQLVFTARKCRGGRIWSSECIKKEGRYSCIRRR